MFPFTYLHIQSSIKEHFYIYDSFFALLEFISFRESY